MDTHICSTDDVSSVDTAAISIDHTHEPSGLEQLAKDVRVDIEV